MHASRTHWNTIPLSYTLNQPRSVPLDSASKRGRCKPACDRNHGSSPAHWQPWRYTRCRLQIDPQASSSTCRGRAVSLSPAASSCKAPSTGIRPHGHLTSSGLVRFRGSIPRLGSSFCTFLPPPFFISPRWSVWVPRIRLWMCFGRARSGALIKRNRHAHLGPSGTQSHYRTP